MTHPTSMYFIWGSQYCAAFTSDDEWEDQEAVAVSASQLFLCLILQCVPGNALEGSIHINVLLGRCLKVGDAAL